MPHAVKHTFPPRTQGAKPGESLSLQGWSGLDSEFQANQNYNSETLSPKQYKTKQPEIYTNSL